MTQPSTMARRESGPPFIWLPADNCPMTPQVLSSLTQKHSGRLQVSPAGRAFTTTESPTL